MRVFEKGENGMIENPNVFDSLYIKSPPIRKGGLGPPLLSWGSLKIGCVPNENVTVEEYRPTTLQSADH